MKIYASLNELVGHTPLLELKRYTATRQAPLAGRILIKLESKNPAGSAKDRVARGILDDAEAKGLLKPGSVILEPTSGNTGIGLSALAAARGYRAIIIMPDSMSPERIALMRAYGAEVVLTPGKLGMKGALDKAEELKGQMPGSMIAGQFVNPANPRAHYTTTGPEIWEDTDGQVAAFVAGVGTGGTVTGVGRFLKEKNPDVKIVAVEPASSPLLTEGHAGPHGIQGIGANFVPAVLDRAVIDEILPCTDDNAFACARELVRTEGVLTGFSSGAALWAATQLAARPEFAGKLIVALLPDTGERYLSTGRFQ